MAKKIIIIAATIAAVAGIGAIIYYGRETLSILQISPAPKGEQKAAPPVPSRLKKLSSQVVFDYAPAGDGVIYAGETGQIIKIDPSGKEEALSDAVENLHFFAVSPDGEKILIGSGTRDDFQLNLLVVADKVLKPLNKSGIASASWSPDSKKIAYLKTNAGGGENELFILDVSREKISDVKAMSFALMDYKIEWPAQNRIILSPRPSALYDAPILAVDPVKKTINALTASASGIAAKWLPTLKWGLVFSESETERFFTLTNENGQTLVDLSRFGTLPRKCAFDETAAAVFCAVAKEVPEGAIFSDDYLKKILYTSDDLYSFSVINRNTGEERLKTEKYYDFEPLTIDADNLAIKNGKLYFINRYDEKIYSLDLSE